MSILIALWLPILLSAGAVFIVSSVIHMVLKWHAPEYRPLANEEVVRAAIRAGAPAPGQYVIPHCADMKDMASEAMLAKYNEGPVGYLTLAANGAPNIGRSLGQWFVMSLAIAAIAGYATARIIGLDGHAHAAAHNVFVISLLGYGMGSVQNAIWWNQPWRSTAFYLLDALLYAAASAAVFLWLWS